jgi:tripartite-type tricarboxylate transporter receptor subunit TctC
MAGRRIALARLAAATAAALVAVLLVAGTARAEYPEKPVRIILPYGPGGVADVTTRLVAQKLSERMGQNFFIDNRPGAGGIIAARAVLGFPPDGYTLFLSGNGSAISQSLFASLPFDIERDFAPVAMLAQFEMLLAVKAGHAIDSVEKLVAYAKAHPGKLNFGSVAVGSTQNLSAELFRMTTGIEVALVTYRTTPDLVTAIVRGDVDVGFDYFAAMRPMIVAQQLRIIATSGDHRNAELGVPTVQESGYPDYVVTSWNALNAPAAIPKDAVAKLNREVNVVLDMPDIKARMAELGMEPLIGPPAAMAERMRRDAEKWRVVIEKAGIPKQ